MKYSSTLIAVHDINRTKRFYSEVLGIKPVNDFGANVIFEGGFCAQTIDTWCGFIFEKKRRIRFDSRNYELYFEETDFDEFIKKLMDRDDIVFVHKVIEHSWGQRAVRFYDPDMHIIEVGENIGSVCRRFMKEGMSIEETAKRMDVSEAYLLSCLEDK